jgi:hypothetical protein
MGEASVSFSQIVEKNSSARALPAAAIRGNMLRTKRDPAGSPDIGNK